MVEEKKVKELEGEPDFVKLAEAASNLTEPQITKALEDYTPETLTQESILAAFEKVKEES